VPVTFGSDAHAPAEVAADFAAACALMQQAGYTEFIAFEARQRRRTPLPIAAPER
jgi:histidinol phosphatase-like PHP family hydrolase